MALINLIQGKQIEVNLTGSFTGSFTGNLIGTSSFASTASFAQSGNGSFSGSFSGSGANLNSIPASAIIGLNLSQIATGSVTASVTPTQFTVTSGSSTELVVTGTGVTIGNAITDSHRITGSLNISGSVTATRFTGSLFGTASWATNSISASFAISSSRSVSSSFATTASFAQQAQNANFATDSTTSQQTITLVGFSAASIDQINIGQINEGDYAYIVKAQELEQSKYATHNIYNNLNFI